MKRWLLTLLVLLVAALPAAASWVFTEGTDYVEISDNTALTLPSGDFTVTGWLMLADNTGTGSQVFVEWFNGSGTDACFRLEVYEHSSATNADKLRASFREATHGWLTLTSSTTPGTSMDWQHVVVERASGVYSLYLNNAQVASNNYPNYAAVDEDSSWKFGGTGSAASAFGGNMAEWAKWDSALSSTQRDQLAGTGDYAGDPHKPSEVGSPVWYFDMYDGIDCQIGGLTVTNHSATVDSGTHPITYANKIPPPWVRRIWRPL